MSQEWFDHCTCLNDHEDHPCPFDVKQNPESNGYCDCCPWCTGQCEIEEPVT